jgi:tetratricopeptide (TPR) repeat protein
MDEEKDWLFGDDEILGFVQRFEDMNIKKEQYFFDVHELEEIINYYINNNNFPKAVSAAEFAHRMYPYSTVIQLKIAHLLIDHGKFVESMSILNKLELIEGSNYEVCILKGTAYNMVGKINEAQQQFDKAVELTEENRGDVLYNIGVAFEQYYQYDSAIKYFLESLKEGYDNLIVYYDIAYCYDRLENLPKSIEYYEKYLDEDPYSDNAWFNLGTVYNRAGNDEKAIEAYDYAIAINENYASAYFNKGNILSNLGRYQDALNEYLEFIKLEEKNVMALCYIGECYEKLNNLDQSFFYFQKAIAIDPNSSDAWFGCGIVKMHLDLLDESLMFIKRALDLNEENTEYLYALGLIYMRKNDLINSEKIFKNVVELDPTDFESWLNYSEIYYITNNYEKAIEILNKAQDINYHNALIQIRLAAYHFLSGKTKQGYHYTEKALNIDPECIDDLYEFCPETIGDSKIKVLVENISN